MFKYANEFFNKVKILGFDKIYDYCEAEYKNNRTKIKIKCIKHNTFFMQVPYEHLKHFKSCPFCCQNKKMTNETFIQKAIKVHGERYDYSLVNYIQSKTKVKIICKEHGIFEQRPYLHLQNNNCPKCRTEYAKNFINKSNIIHSNKYDYSLVNYINNNTKVKIICKKHGIFEQTPHHHIRGNGCSSCNESKGETIINGVLNFLNIKFEKQKKFKNCKDKQLLSFDFYLIDYNICVEFDGRHHFETIDYWGGEEKLKYTQKHDKMKNIYCKKNNIKLIRIKHDIKFNKIVEIFEKIKI